LAIFPRLAYKSLSKTFSNFSMISTSKHSRLLHQFCSILGLNCRVFQHSLCSHPVFQVLHSFCHLLWITFPNLHSYPSALLSNDQLYPFHCFHSIRFEFFNNFVTLFKALTQTLLQETSVSIFSQNCLFCCIITCQVCFRHSETLASWGSKGQVLVALP
jgi:hypothetical protein